MKAIMKLADFPDYMEAQAKLNSLRLQLTEAERQHNDYTVQLNQQTNAPRDPIRETAEALLAGEEVATDGKGLRERAREMQVQVQVLRTAENLQERKVAELQSKHSRAICANADKHYRKLVQEAIAAAVALSKAHDALAGFMDDLGADGAFVSLTSYPNGLRRLGRWSVPESVIHLVLEQAEADGFLTDEYRNRPKASTDPDLQRAGVVRLAAGPEGVRTVETTDGEPKTVKWHHKVSDKERDARQRDGWAA